MTDSAVRVSDHYTLNDLEERILTALRKAGKDVQALTVDDLAPVDEFHIRGRAATEELAGWAEISSEDEVLDVGSGLGGTSRYLAATRGCATFGVDLTEEYCRVAERLSGLVGLGDRTSFRVGSALELPFEDARFDVVWTEHVQMNIEDKPRFYGELARVLKPGGQLAFHDILAGGESPPHFPVPWAKEGSISHLIAPEDLRRLLGDLGFDPVRWEDKTEAAQGFFRDMFRRVEEEGPAHLGLHVLMEEAPVKLRNVLRNLDEGRIRLAQAVMRRIP